MAVIQITGGRREQGFDNMKLFWKAALASAVMCGANMTAAHGATTVVDGAACVSVASAQGCRFNGNINGSTNLSTDASFLNAQNAYNLYNDSVLSANPDIALNFLASTDDSFAGINQLNGTWSLPGFAVNFLAVKAGNQFVLYGLPTPLSSGSWSTAGLLNGKGKQHGLSHLAFFGQRSAVPEPATWLMMIAGFGLIGGAMRRRKAVTALA